MRVSRIIFKSRFVVGFTYAVYHLMTKKNVLFATVHLFTAQSRSNEKLITYGTYGKNCLRINYIKFQNVKLLVLGIILVHIVKEFDRKVHV